MKNMPPPIACTPPHLYQKYLKAKKLSQIALVLAFLYKYGFPLSQIYAENSMPKCGPIRIYTHRER